MPATVIAERVGWSGSITWFRDNVRRLRPEHRRPDPADRLVWAPGDAAQCDLWFPPRRIPLEDGSTVAAAGAGDRRGALAVHHRPDAADPQDRGPAAGIVGADPAAGPGAAAADLGQRSRASAEAAGSPPGVAAFAGTLATKVVQLPPYDPESKGIVERRNGFFETSFMPGRSLHLAGGLQRPVQPTGCSGANQRVVRTIKARPVDLIEHDRAADAAAAAGPAAAGLAGTGPARPGLLRPPRRQRLLRRPDRDRPDGRRQRRPGPGPGPARRPAGRRPCPGLGPRQHGHRPGPRRRPRRCCAQQCQPAPDRCR